MFLQIARNGQRLGEFSETMISSKLYSGELQLSDLCLGEGMTTWRPISEHRLPLRIASRLLAVSSERRAESRVATISLVIDTPAATAFVGSLLTLFGVFAPAVTIPLLGSMNHIENGRAAGVVLILAAVVSAVFAALRWFKGLWLTGAVAIVCLLGSLIAFQFEIHRMKSSAAVDKNNFLAGLESAADDATQLGWGYAVLLCGALLLLTAAAIGTGRLQVRR